MPGIKAFVAAVFGGIGSIPGAMIGGVLLGVIEQLSKAYISSQLSDAIVFLVLRVVLVVRPTGLLGKKINEKAFIEWGKTYVLDTENGAVIKNIRRTDNPEVIECVSLNPAYQPFTMETRYINGWYRVLMCLSLK